MFRQISTSYSPGFLGTVFDKTDNRLMFVIKALVLLMKVSRRLFCMFQIDLLYGKRNVVYALLSFHPQVSSLEGSSASLWTSSRANIYHFTSLCSRSLRKLSVQLFDKFIMVVSPLSKSEQLRSDSPMWTYASTVCKRFFDAKSVLHFVPFMVYGGTCFTFKNVALAPWAPVGFTTSLKPIGSRIIAGKHCFMILQWFSYNVLAYQVQNYLVNNVINNWWNAAQGFTEQSA